MYVIFGILGTILSILIELICEALFNLDILNFYVEFIPLGGLIFGLLIGWFINKGVKVSNKKFNKSIMIVSVLFLAFSFVSIIYSDYKTTYVTGTDGNYEFNHKFDGEPISNFAYAGKDGKEVQLTFVNYFKFSMDTSKLQIRLFTVNTTGTINYIIEIANLIFMIVVGAAMVYGVTSCIYCDECKKYHKSKKVFQVNENDIAEIMENGEIVNDMNTIKQFIGSHSQKYSAKDYYLGKISYCPNCSKGSFIVTHINTEGKSRVEKSITVTLDSTMVPYLLA